jgi:hypothetical protein
MTSALSRGLAPRMRPINPKRSAVVAALDIGTSKIACLIARLKPLDDTSHLGGRTHSVELIGFGHTRARGIKAGAVIDMARAEEAIRLAVDAAERSAKLEIASVILSVSGGRLGSDSFSASTRLIGPSVGRATSAARSTRRACTPCAMAAPFCIRCRSVTELMAWGIFAIRAGCWATRCRSICM